MKVLNTNLYSLVSVCIILLSCVLLQYKLNKYKELFKLKSKTNYLDEEEASDNKQYTETTILDSNLKSMENRRIEIRDLPENMIKESQEIDRLNKSALGRLR